MTRKQLRIRDIVTFLAESNLHWDFNGNNEGYAIDGSETGYDYEAGDYAMRCARGYCPILARYVATADLADSLQEGYTDKVYGNEDYAQVARTLGLSEKRAALIVNAADRRTRPGYGVIQTSWRERIVRRALLNAVGLKD